MNIFSRRKKAPLAFDIPEGAFTYDSEGQILVGSVRLEWLEEFGPLLVRLLKMGFAQAEEKGLLLTEIALYYAGVKIIARDLRGGGIVYVLPLSTKP